MKYMLVRCWRWNKYWYWCGINVGVDDIIYGVVDDGIYVDINDGVGDERIKVGVDDGVNVGFDKIKVGVDDGIIVDVVDGI